jgi:hypothetical protein
VCDCEVFCSGVCIALCVVLSSSVTSASSGLEGAQGVPKREGGLFVQERVVWYALVLGVVSCGVVL